MDLSKFSRDDWIFVGVGLLLAIDLLFLPWFDYSKYPAPFTQSASLAATGSPDGWLGVLGLLAALAVVADLAVDRLGSSELPTIGGSRASTRLVLAYAVAAFLGLKFVIHAHFSLFGFGFWAGAVLTIALVSLAVRARQAESSATHRAQQRA
jgi:hypothetical protein